MKTRTITALVAASSRQLRLTIVEGKSRKLEIQTKKPQGRGFFASFINDEEESVKAGVMEVDMKDFDHLKEVTTWLIDNGCLDDSYEVLSYSPETLHLHTREGVSLAYVVTANAAEMIKQMETQNRRVTKVVKFGESKEVPKLLFIDEVDKFSEPIEGVPYVSARKTLLDQHREKYARELESRPKPPEVTMKPPLFKRLFVANRNWLLTVIFAANLIIYLLQK